MALPLETVRLPTRVHLYISRVGVDTYKIRPSGQNAGFGFYFVRTDFPIKTK